MSSRRHSIPRDALEKIIAAAGTLPRGADIALLSEDIYSAGIQVGLRDEIHSTAAFDARVKDFSRLQSLMHQVAKLFGENGRFKRRHVESSFILNALEDLPAAVDMLNHVRAGRNAPPTIEADLKSLLRIAHRFQEYAKRADRRLRSSTKLSLDTTRGDVTAADTWLIGERLPAIYRRYWGTTLGSKGHKSIAFVQECLRVMGRPQKTADNTGQIIKRYRRGTRAETVGMKSPR